jgi:acetyl esterase/lipase
MAGLGVLAGDARRSARILDGALRRAGVDPPEQPRLRRPGGVLPGRLARRRYRRAADLNYGGDPRSSTLDVWHRADLPADGRAPVLIQVHGGAWEMGDKLGQAEPLMGYLAERGWVCVTVNYRLAPAHRWPAMIVDVKRAIAWTREHIAGFGGDPGFMAITGGSAGGHLAALAALSPNDPDFQPGFEDADTTLSAAVPMYGVFDFTHDQQGLWSLLEHKVIQTRYADDARTWERASPALRIGPHTPPFLVLHGSTDTIVGVNQSRRFADALRASSPSPVGYAELPRAQHGFDALPTARTAYTAAAVHRFLSAMHARATARSDPATPAEAGPRRAG